MHLLSVCTCIAVLSSTVRASNEYAKYPYTMIKLQNSGLSLEASPSRGLKENGVIYLYASSASPGQQFTWNGPNGDILRNNLTPEKVLTCDSENYNNTTATAKAYLSKEDTGKLNQRWRVDGNNIICKDEKTAGVTLALQVDKGNYFACLKVGKLDQSNKLQKWNIRGAPPKVSFVECNQIKNSDVFDLCLSISGGEKYAGLKFYKDSGMVLNGHILDKDGNVIENSAVSVNILSDKKTAIAAITDPGFSDEKLYQVRIDIKDGDLA